MGMTRLDALRRLVTAPRTDLDQGRIGRRVRYATPDGREKMPPMVVKVLRSVIRRIA